MITHLHLSLLHSKPLYIRKAANGSPLSFSLLKKRVLQKDFYVYRYISTISQSPLVLVQIGVHVELINMHEREY